jgi:cytochrome c oxidase subunit 3
MAHVFFGIYFFMTGLHGFHVLIGIGIWIWMLVKASKGQFGPTYFGPIDFTALYWHLVDLIWIYLFPLLYLIH